MSTNEIYQLLRKTTNTHVCGERGVLLVPVLSKGRSNKAIIESAHLKDLIVARVCVEREQVLFWGKRESEWGRGVRGFGIRRRLKLQREAVSVRGLNGRKGSRRGNIKSVCNEISSRKR